MSINCWIIWCLINHSWPHCSGILYNKAFLYHRIVAIDTGRAKTLAVCMMSWNMNHGEQLSRPGLAFTLRLCQSSVNFTQARLFCKNEVWTASLNGKVRHHLYTFADQTSSRHFAITMEHVVLTIFKYVRGNCMDMNYYSFGLKYYSNLLPVLSSGVLCFTWLVPQGFPSKQCQEVVSTFSQGLLYLLWDCWQPTVLPTASVACRSSWGSKHTVWAFPLWC